MKNVLKSLKGKKFLFSLLFALMSLSGIAFAAHAYAGDVDNTPDCDTVAIIRCGAFSRDALLQKYDQDAYGDLQKVYGAFGISRADMAGGHVYQGVVWRDGRVTIGSNTVVATNALTAGRWYNPTGDMQYIPGTVRAYKMSTSHFVDAGQTAMIWMVNGKFQFAVVKPCSNPVTATPVQSVAQCDSLQADKISRNEFHFTAHAHASGLSKIVGYKFYFGDGNPVTTKSNQINHTFAKSGDHLVRVAALVETMGQTREVTSDKCQVHVNVTPPPTYSCDRLTAQRISRNEFKFTATASAGGGATIVGYKFYFGDGNPIVTKSRVINHTFPQLGDHLVRVAALIKINGQTKEVTSDKCRVTVNVPAAPSYSCDLLTADKISRTEFKFNGNASADHGAKITQYSFDFGDGSKPGVVKTGAGSASINHTYAKDGTYTARLTVTIQVDGQTKQVTSDKCVTKVTVAPQAPVYSCDSLTADKISRNSFAFTANGTAEHGVTISKYTFDFGDGSKPGVVNTDKTTAKINHEYAKDGTYTARVTITMKVNGQTKEVTGPKCVVKVTVIPQTPVYSCDLLTADRISRTEFKFNGNASADKGAKITQYSFDFGDGSKPGVVKTSAGSASIKHNYAKDGTYTARLTVTIQVGGQTKQVTSDKCVTKVTVAPQPQYSCDLLSDTKISRTEFKFTGNASAKDGATIVSYSFNFGDGSQPGVIKTDKGTATLNHTYAQAGTYNATLTVTVKVNGQLKEVTSPKCAVQVTVNNEHQPGEYGCIDLTAKLIGYDGSATKYKYDLEYKATGKITLRDVDFNFGDGHTLEGVTPDQLNDVTHSYAKPGNYKTATVLHFNVKGDVKDDTCQTMITIQPCIYNPDVPAGSNKCTPPCVEQGTPTTNPNAPICEHKPTCADHPTTPECTTPPELPSTGPEAVIGSLFGSSALGYGLYSYATSRRTLRNSMKR